MGESEIYSYDLNNNLISKTDRNQNRLTITYNALNQPLKYIVTQHDGKVLSQQNSYAVNGAIIKAENENIKTSFYYDNQGRVVKEEDNRGIAQTYRVCKINCAFALSEYKIKRKGRNTYGEEKASFTC